MARPRLELDEEKIKQLAMINCSLAEIAAVMDCDVKTLTNRYSQVIEKGRENGKSSLKKKQFEIAMKGNVTMLIWLGKILLGQKDTTYQRVSGPEGGPIEVSNPYSKYTDQELEQAIIVAERKHEPKNSAPGEA